jgi:hypothetical protein
MEEWRRGEKTIVEEFGGQLLFKGREKKRHRKFYPDMRKSLFPYVLWLNRIPYVSHVNIQAREIALNSRVQELSFIGLGNGVPLKVWSFVRVYRVRTARARWSVS